MENNSRLTQRRLILSHFKKGGQLTKAEAIKEPFYCTNLGDQVFNLRKQGFPIDKKMIKSANGAKFAIYYLESEAV